MYQEALEAIKNSHYILILTHINPDADTLSCGLALSNFMFENNINHKVFNKMNDLPRNIDYLNRYTNITNKLPDFYDLVIYVDCGDQKRPAIHINEGVKIINIDHHASNENFGCINIVDDTKSSTAEVLYQFFKQNDIEISSNTATCLYTGIYDDSIRFSTPRVNVETFEIAHHLCTCGANPSYIADMLTKRESLAKLRLLPFVLQSLELHLEGKIGTIYLLPEWLKTSGASYRDAEDAVNMVLSIAIIDIAILLRPTNGKTRISLRSKNEIDVSKIAINFNGGGHTMAAGCTIENEDVLIAKNEIINFIKEAYGKKF
ncbi:MAG: bifunctional oligoribonuclease/PAP phosphatase NrnA [Epsilonproteobacteria bacterium]|nr:bifunctional oligoribonuclease/PAP phosphatase NrnA [Campylobacterota bacterium]